jgi:hypothetical protein
MRETFIGVFGGVVLIVSVLSFALMRLTLGDVSNKGQAQLVVNAAAAQLELETLRAERWLAAQVADDAAHAPFEAASKDTGDLATKVADTIAERAKISTDMASIKSEGIYVFDEKGAVLGRDNSKLSRGDQLGETYPDLLKTVMAGKTGSALWISKALGHRMLASYAPIRNAQGKVIGGVAFGRPLLSRLNAVSELTGKSALFAVVPAGDNMEIFAKTDAATAAMDAGIASSKAALGSDQPHALERLPADLEGAARGLTSYGNGKQAVVVAVTSTRVIGGFGSLLYGVLGALAMGLVLTAVCAHMVDKYVSQPVEDLEEGLLAIINGQTDIRFELEHKMYGGLVFRLNSLLNQLLGVQEDNTDEEGRPSHTPPPVQQLVLTIDERMATLSPDEVADASTLRNEAPEDYYKRMYDEFLAAKREAGDAIESLKFAQFSQRLKQSELQMSQKHGKPFRFKVEVKGNDVSMLAVPLE